MEGYWGVEVKNGERLKVLPGDGFVLHLSQASLGELNSQKEKENVFLFVHVDGKKLVLGTLITNKLPQYQFNVSLDRDFELSHNWKSGSVYFYGYKANKSKSKEDTPLNLEKNGKTDSMTKQEKIADAPKAKVYIGESDAGSDPVKIAHTQNALNTQEADESTFEDLMSDGDEDDSKVITSKKRSIESVEFATTTPICEKKAKLIPERTDLTGNEDNATPTSQLKQQTVKKHPCKICNKLFTTEEGVECHTKVKHGGVNQF